MAEPETILATGLAGLDAALGGGITQRALALVIGAPGAGKTVLASNIVFNAARQGVKVLVFTSYSEGNDQYVQHMRHFDFFDAALLGNNVQLFSLQSQMSGDESSAVAIIKTIRATGAKIVLIDGFQSVYPGLSGQQSTRELLAGLAVQIRYLDVTLILTIAGDARDANLHAELTVADLTIGLSYTASGLRHQRMLEVVKQRGRAQLPGLHRYTIDKQGIQVFPRIEVYPQPSALPHDDSRAAFGLAEFDHMLGGGINTGTSATIAGAPGAGKTTLGLYWALAEAHPEAVSLIITFSEYPEQLQRKAAAFQLDLQGAMESGAVRILRIPPIELNPDNVATLVLAELAARPVRRVLFDDISLLLHELGERTSDYISALNALLYGYNITSLYLLEIAAFEGLRINPANTPLAALGDSVIIVQQYEIQGVLRRLLAILRMRLSLFDRTLRELVLDETGIRVLRPEESATGVLNTAAHLGGGTAPEVEA